jgi:hypothetical protein
MHGVPGLKHGLHAPRAAALHETKMPAVIARHQLEDDARFPLPAKAEHDALVRPVQTELLSGAR